MLIREFLINTLRSKFVNKKVHGQLSICSCTIHDISDKSGKKEVKCFSAGAQANDDNGKLAIVINRSEQIVAKTIKTNTL